DRERRCDDCLRRDVEQFQQRLAVGSTMRRNLAFAAAAPDDTPAREPAVGERLKPVGAKLTDADHVGHNALATKCAGLDILATTRVTQIGVAETREDAPDRDVQHRLEATQLSLKRLRAAADFAEAASEEVHAQCRIGPIDAVKIDAGAIPETARNVG